MKKRIIGLLMALCLIVGLLPVTALADDTPASTVKKVAITTGAGGADNRKEWTEDFAAPVYGKTSEDGTAIDWENATDTDYNISISQSTAGLELTLKDANLQLDCVDNFAIWVQYDGPLTVKLVGNNTINNMQHNSPACLFLRATSTVITGGGSLTAYNQGYNISSQFTYIDGSKQYHYNYASVIDCDNDLTIKDVTLDLKTDSISNNPWAPHCIRASGNVVIDNAKLDLYSEFANGINIGAHRHSSVLDTTGKTITIKNGSKVNVDAKVYGFRPGDAGAVIIDKTNGTEVVVKTLAGPFKFTPVIQGNADVEIVYSANADGSDAKAYTYQEKQLLTAYTEMLYFSLTHKHTGGTATCAKKAECTICGEEYGEPVAHTYTRTDCSQDSICSVCNQVAVPAGAHTGGAATCTAKAKCEICNAEYGELAAHTPDADDKDCTTAVKCSVCKAETTAAKQHKYTNDTDKTCNNNGCNHVRSLTGDDSNAGTNNPNTGDVSILLTAAIALSSAVGFAGVTVLRKKEN